jgi:hypothetical protein
MPRDDSRVAADVVNRALDAVVVSDEVQIALIVAHDTIVPFGEAASIDLNQRTEHADGRAEASREDDRVEWRR